MGQHRESPHSLRVTQEDVVVFESNGSWLHPLFDLEKDLKSKDIDPATLALEDKIIGKAAALLIIRLRIRTVHAGLISIPARDVFDTAGISYTFDECVPLIECATEQILRDVSDPEDAYLMISERIAANS